MVDVPYLADLSPVYYHFKQLAHLLFLKIEKGIFIRIQLRNDCHLLFNNN
jgi:hypothetical protein